MRKMNKIAMIVIVLLIGLSACSNDRDERGSLVFGTQRPYPSTDRYGGVDMFFDLRVSDISTSGRWDILDARLYNTRIYVESTSLQRDDRITITLDDGRMVYEINAVTNNNEGLYINGLDTDVRLCDYMDGVINRLINRGSVEFKVTVILTDYRGKPISNAFVNFSMDNTLDLRVTD